MFHWCRPYDETYKTHHILRRHHRFPTIISRSLLPKLQPYNLILFPNRKIQNLVRHKCLQVPILKDLILRWAENTGFDIPRQPSERALKHAVMQAFAAASAKRSSPGPRAASLPRASRQEMDIAAGTADAPHFPLNPGISPGLNPTPGPAGVTARVAALSLASSGNLAPGLRTSSSESPLPDRGVQIPSEPLRFGSLGSRARGATVGASTVRSWSQVRGPMPCRYSQAEMFSPWQPRAAQHPESVYNRGPV